MANEQASRRNAGDARRALREAVPFVCCAICGLEIPTCVTVAHLDQNSANNQPDNLAWLCQTHHWMYDCGFYPPEAIRLLQDRWQITKAVPDHKARTKDAGARAAETRMAAVAAKKCAAKVKARKAWKTRRARAEN